MAAEPELLEATVLPAWQRGLRLVDPKGDSLGSPGKLQQPHSYNRFLQLKELC